MKAGLDELERRVPGAKLGATGFCFGGGMVWALLDAGDERLAAAIPFYGPAPAAPDFSGNSAAVLGVYAELDAPGQRLDGETAEAALTAAGLEHELKTYPGVDHAFFNDTGQRYNAEQAAAAYADVLDWLGRYLAYDRPAHRAVTDARPLRPGPPAPAQPPSFRPAQNPVLSETGLDPDLLPWRLHCVPGSACTCPTTPSPTRRRSASSTASSRTSTSRRRPASASSP